MKKEESQLHLDTQYKLGEINQSLKNVVKTLNEYHEEMLEYVKENNFYRCGRHGRQIY